MGAKKAVVVLACSLLLSSCTDDRLGSSRASTDSGSGTATPVVSQSPPPELAFVDQDAPVVQNLWRRADSLEQLRTNLPPRLDFRVIRQSPRLTESSIGPAVLAVGTEPGPYKVGDPAVVNAVGDWRMIERDHLGMRNPDIVEQQFELSPDGATIALGDEYGIVFLDLITGESTRVRLGVKDPVIHAWTNSGEGVLVTRRLHRTNPAWEVRMDDAAVTRAPFDPWRSSVQRDGSVAELATPGRGATAGSFTAIRMWRRGQVEDTRRLRVGVALQAFVANEGNRWVGYRQDRRLRVKAAGGFGVLDPHTGEAVGFLGLPPRPLTWVSQQGFIGERWVILNVPYGNGGGLFAWDPVAQRLRTVTRTDDQAANISLAASLID